MFVLFVFICRNTRQVADTDEIFVIDVGEFSSTV